VYNFFYTGEPVELDDSSMEDAMEDASTRVKEQQRKNPSSYGRSSMLARLLTGGPDPDEEEQMEDGDELEVWKLLPHLKKVPEGMLKRLPISAIFQLNSALAKESKNSEKMSVCARLAENAEKLIRCPTKIPSGEDDRCDNLHTARFLGGPSCSAAEVWLKARKHIGPKGVLALGNYELDSVGCGGSVTPKGWQAIQDPSSQELKIKQFYLPNVSSSGISTRRLDVGDGEETVTYGTSLKEIADLEGYKGALNTLREAMAAALPWNRSISAIMGFMTNSNYLQADLGNNSKRTVVLVEFTAYILSRNALNWQNSQAFVSTDEMSHIWLNWKGKRASLFTSTQEKKRDNNRDKSKKEKGADICKRYNSGTCVKQTDKECTTFFGTKLRHVCNKYTTGGGLCEKSHPRKDHT